MSRQCTAAYPSLLPSPLLSEDHDHDLIIPLGNQRCAAYSRSVARAFSSDSDAVDSEALLQHLASVWSSQQPYEAERTELIPN